METRLRRRVLDSSRALDKLKEINVLFCERQCLESLRYLWVATSNEFYRRWLVFTFGT